MTRNLTVTAKLTILLLLAVAFAATLIALSAREPRTSRLSHIGGHYGDDSKRMEQTFAVGSGGKLTVDTDYGSVSITGSDREDVSVVVTAEGDDEELDNFDVSFNQEENLVRITGRQDRKHFRFFDNHSLDVHFEVKIPNRFNLDIRTSGGDLAVQAVDGTIYGETSGGDLDIVNAKGTVNMETSGGDINIRSVEGELVAMTSGGNIYGETVTAKTRVETSGGNITFRDADGELNASTSGGDIRVGLKDNKGIDVSTSGGSITISLPKNIAANVDAESSGGDVSCDFAFSGKIKEGTMNGSINGGGNLIRAETSGGDISIRSVE